MVVGLGSLELKREGDTLVLSWKKTDGLWIGASFLVTLIVLLFGWLHQESSSANPFGPLLFVALFAAAGLIFGLPRKVETTFDLSSRQLSRHYRFCCGLYDRTDIIPFEKVAGLKITEEDPDGGYYCWASILLKNRGRRLLGTASIKTQCSMLIDEVCAATGLTKLEG